jgi:hypothetical protein
MRLGRNAWFFIYNFFPYIIIVSNQPKEEKMFTTKRAINAILQGQTIQNAPIKIKMKRTVFVKLMMSQSWPANNHNVSYKAFSCLYTFLEAVEEARDIEFAFDLNFIKLLKENVRTVDPTKLDYLPYEKETIWPGHETLIYLFYDVCWVQTHYGALDLGL